MNHDQNTPNATVIPLHDQAQGRTLYHRSLLRLMLAGAVAGALIAGAVAFLVVSGILPIAHLGQFSAAGSAPPVFAGAGCGFALGGLLGGLYGLRHRVEIT